MPVLRAYLENRETWHNEIRAHKEDAFWDTEVAGEQLSPKFIINATLNGSITLSVLVAKEFAGTLLYELCMEFQRALEIIFTTFTDIPYNEHSSQLASRMTNLLLTMENAVMYSVLVFLVSKGLLCTTRNAFDCALAYDGIMLPGDAERRELLENEVNAFLPSLGLEFLFMRGKPLCSDSLTPVELVRGQMRLQPIDADEGKKILVKSPTGSGKTYQTMKYAVENHRCFLYISHRQSLAIDIKRKYPTMGCYLPTENSRRTFSADQQIICVNSLTKLGDPNKYTCIIADEISSLLEQIVDMKMPRETVEVFEVFLRKTDCVFIGMDALLCAIDHEFMKTIGPYRLIRPSTVSVPERVCTIVDDFDYIKSMISVAITGGERVCIAYSIGIFKMEGYLESMGVNYLNVNKFSREKGDVDTFRNYDVLAYSPTMDAGVDVSFFDDEGERVGHFDKVFGLFHMDNTSPKRAVQMLGRVRDCNQFYVAITGHSTAETFNSKAAFKRHLVARMELVKEYELTTYLRDDFERDVCEDIRFGFTWNCVRKRKQSQTTDYMMYLKKYLVQNQWMIDIDEDDCDAADREAIREAEKTGVRENHRAICEANVIDCETARKYSEMSGDLSLDQYRELLAYNVMDSCGLTIGRDPPPHVMEFMDLDAMTAYRAWREKVWQEQFDLLQCYDDIKKTRFDYIGFYMQNRLKFYRLKQLADVYENNGELPKFSFVYSRRSFNEITHVAILLLRKLGFQRLTSTLAHFDWECVRQDRYLTQCIKGGNAKLFLQRHTGITIEKIDGLYRLSNNVASNDNETEAMYIRGLSIPYSNPSKKKWTCPRCFIEIYQRNRDRHVCRALPLGFSFRILNGERKTFCDTCNYFVTRNLSRHAQIHQ
jgi:hypothetical protein